MSGVEPALVDQIAHHGLRAGGRKLTVSQEQISYLISGGLLGLGLVVATANTFFRDCGHLVSVFLQAWYFATPILYYPHQTSRWMILLKGIMKSISLLKLQIAVSALFILGVLLTRPRQRNLA